MARVECGRLAAGEGATKSLRGKGLTRPPAWPAPMRLPLPLSQGCGGRRHTCVAGESTAEGCHSNSAAHKGYCTLCWLLSTPGAWCPMALAASARAARAAAGPPKQEQQAAAAHRQRWLKPVSRMRKARSVSATTAARSRPLVHAASGSARRLRRAGKNSQASSLGQAAAGVQAQGYCRWLQLAHNTHPGERVPHTFAANT